MTDQPYVGAPDSAPTAGGRALVLGGGGSTGNAWLLGVVAGLADAGVDVTTADVTVGTSAGATAAAQLAGASPAELYAAALVAPPARGAGRRSAPARDQTGAVGGQLARIREISAAASDAADLRRRLGAALLELDEESGEAWSMQWRAIVASRLPSQSWPERTVLLTAVDARTGDGVVFDRNDGVDLVDAVAASCSSGRAYRIGDGRYIDGGYRRNENADLASGCARVLVLAPLGGRTLHPSEWGLQLAAQVDELRAAGTTVETVVPEPESEHLFSSNAMDLSLRPAAARAGYEQGSRLAPQLAGASG